MKFHSLGDVIERDALKVAALLFFIAATLVMLFPLSAQSVDHVPDLEDPLENAWVLAWDAHQLLNDPLALYDANIFYPYANSLAFSESQLASAVAGMPIYLLSNNPILAYNFVYLLSFVLCGFNTFLLAYDVTRNHWGALLAGFAFAFWPYRMEHLSHINLVTLQWLPLVLLSFRGALVSPRGAMPILFALTFTLQALSSWYAALMTSFGVGLYALYFFTAHRRPDRVRVARLALAAAVSLAVVITIAIPYFQLSGELNLARSPRDTEMFSATPLNFISVAHNNNFYQNILPHDTAEPLFPGALVLGLAVVGALPSLKIRDGRFWLLLIFAFAILALGPSLRYAPDQPPLPLPYRVLYDYFPGVKGTRAPARFFAVGMLGLTIVAAAGVARLGEKRATKSNLIGAAALLVLAFEYNGLPIKSTTVATGAQVPRVYAWLAQQPSGNFIEFPLERGGVVAFTRPMYYSTYHWHKTPLGYASFVPQTMLDLVNALDNDSDSANARLVNLLREFRIVYLLLHRRPIAPEQLADIESNLRQDSAFHLAYDDDIDRVYTLQGNAPPHPLSLAFLAPSTAPSGGVYQPFVVVQQPRHYPIVNDDLRPHNVSAIWRNGTVEIARQQFQIKLPRVLRDRAEGIPLTLRAPDEQGSYQLELRLDAVQLEPINQKAQVRVERQLLATAPLELISVKIPNPRIVAGDQLLATFFWRKTMEIDRNYEVRLALVDQSGRVLTQVTEHPLLLYTYPTLTWQNNELVALDYTLPVPHDASSGEYHLVIQLIDPRGTPTSFISPDGKTGAEYNTGAIVISAH